MIMLASDWLGLALLLCIFAWYARRWVALTLPVAVVAAAVAVWLPTGSPRFTAPPPGEYSVLGADIQVDRYIDALLKPANGDAVLYRLPYSTQQANALQGAQDGEGGVKAKVGTDGGVGYTGEEPVTGLPPKAPEQPSVTLP